ncbi:MAG: universal stress protein [Elainellaceae cyanobacterium]
MFDRILVAVDHTEASNSLVERAITLAAATKAQVLLLHVLSPDEEGSPGMPIYPNLSYSPSLDEAVLEAYRKRWETFQQKNLSQLEAYVCRAQEHDVKAEHVQRPGSPGKIICDVASSWNADLILMGSHGRSGLSQLLLGSVSNYVTHHAPCSVMLARGNKVASEDTHAWYETMIAQ